SRSDRLRGACASVQGSVSTDGDCEESVIRPLCLAPGRRRVADPGERLDAQLRDVLLCLVRALARSTPACSSPWACRDSGNAGSHWKSVRSLRGSRGVFLQRWVAARVRRRNDSGSWLAAGWVAGLVASVSVPVPHRVRILLHWSAALAVHHHGRCVPHSRGLPESQDLRHPKPAAPGVRQCLLFNLFDTSVRARRARVALGPSVPPGNVGLVCALHGAGAGTMRIRRVLMLPVHRAADDLPAAKTREGFRRLLALPNLILIGECQNPLIVVCEELVKLCEGVRRRFQAGRPNNILHGLCLQLTDAPIEN